MKKEEIESQILALEKQKLQAIKEQNYGYVALMRDQVRELLYKVRSLQK
ncbi:MAG TPA: hypothetical protein VKX29_03515 [Brumimicrobium sp.]|nr:hypothetical protein [Brumimicrobium sp.]